MARLSINNPPKLCETYWVVCDAKVRFDVYRGRSDQKWILTNRYCYDNEKEAQDKFNELKELNKDKF